MLNVEDSWPVELPGFNSAGVDLTLNALAGV